MGRSPLREVHVSWSLQGSYVETCSCDLKVGDAIDFEIEDVVPFGKESGEPVKFQGMFHPVASDLTIAEATRSRINAFGIEYEGKTGLSTSEFSWAA
jgi:hypothetical protein